MDAFESFWGDLFCRASAARVPEGLRIGPFPDGRADFYFSGYRVVDTLHSCPRRHIDRYVPVTAPFTEKSRRINFSSQRPARIVAILGGERISKDNTQHSSAGTLDNLEIDRPSCSSTSSPNAIPYALNGTQRTS